MEKVEYRCNISPAYAYCTILDNLFYFVFIRRMLIEEVTHLGVLWKSCQARSFPVQEHCS